uniref:small ribosomal subunit protein uS7m n=1 Tax=Myxine glutinosa TaxID=7769 RepID=UPI00358DF647
MAVHINMALRASGSLLRVPWVPGLTTTSVRWSMYNPTYLEPDPKLEQHVLRKRTPSAEESPGDKSTEDLKAASPFKATRSNHSSSGLHDAAVDKFVSMIMHGGGKLLARTIMLEALERLKREQVTLYHKTPPGERQAIECNPYAIFHKALENCKPILGLKKMIKGGTTYQVPVLLSEQRRRYLAMTWLIAKARLVKEGKRQFMAEKLADEIKQAAEGQGEVVRKKMDLHRQAEGNRAFAHFRWE